MFLVFHVFDQGLSQNPKSVRLSVKINTKIMNEISPRRNQSIQERNLVKTIAISMWHLNHGCGHGQCVVCSYTAQEIAKVAQYNG